MGKRRDDEPFEFTEEWAAGGVRESSLRRHIAPPPAPPRARRRGALDPPAGPRDWSPSDPFSHAQSRRRVWPIVVMVLIAGGIFAVSWFGHHSRSGPAPVAAGPSSALPIPSNTQSVITGLNPALETGRCFDLSHPDGSGTVQFRSCSAAHTYELTGVENAAGDNSQYPAEAYWQGPVAAQCAADLANYSGQPRAKWPPSLTASEFTPLPNGWANGDRTVYCVAKWAAPRPGSAQNLPAYVPPHPAITSSP